MKKIFTLSVAALFAAMSYSQTIKTLPGNYMTIAISDNGKYAAGTSEANNPIIWDWQNDRVIEDAEKLPEGTAEGIANTGVAVAYTGDEAATFSVDGTIVRLPMVDGYPMALAKAVNADGTIVAGCIANEAYVTHACVWQDGKMTMLPEPTTEEIGFEVNGTQATDMSADGKVIMGFVVDNYSTFPLVIWRLNAEGKYELEMICKDYFNDGEGDPAVRPYTVFYPSGISANGKWVSLQVENWAGDWDYSETRLARLNLETKELEVAVIDGSNGIEANMPAASGRITNDGTLVGYTSSAWGMMGREGLLWKAGESQPQYLRDAFKTIEAIASYDMMTNAPVDITPDGKYITGFGMTGDGTIESYVIDTTPSGTAIDAPETADGESVTSLYDITGKAVSPEAARKNGVYVVKTVQNGKVSVRKVVK